MSDSWDMVFPNPVCPSLDGVGERDWENRAIRLLRMDARRTADTHLVKLHLPALSGIDIYLKDESTHPTGSLKHRLARSLVLYGICNGLIHDGTTLVDASSGSTAVSEAYFARLLGLPFIAVMPASTSRQKIAEIERFGGTCHFVERSSEVYSAAQDIAAEKGGYYLDQFTFAERATDWRSNNNIAESIFSQMESEAQPMPEWVVMGAGTGGTSATIGRYIRYNALPTRLCVVDVENSAFYDCYSRRDPGAACTTSSRIEGIGRPRVEPSFLPSVVDYMIRVPDAASIAAARVLSNRLGHSVGGSTGANFMALCWVAASMLSRGRGGSLVSIICDSGDRYRDTYFSDTWLAASGIDIDPYVAAIERFLVTGQLDLPFGSRGFESCHAPGAK